MRRSLAQGACARHKGTRHPKKSALLSDSALLERARDAQLVTGLRSQDWRDNGAYANGLASRNVLSCGNISPPTPSRMAGVLVWEHAQGQGETILRGDYLRRLAAAPLPKVRWVANSTVIVRSQRHRARLMTKPDGNFRVSVTPPANREPLFTLQSPTPAYSSMQNRHRQLNSESPQCVPGFLMKPVMFGRMAGRCDLKSGRNRRGRERSVRSSVEAAPIARPTHQEWRPKVMSPVAEKRC